MVDKYTKTLKDNAFNLSDEDVTAKINKIIAEKSEENNTVKVLREIYSCIDLTTLNTTDTREDIWKFTDKVNTFEGSNPLIKNVAAVCVFPNLVRTVKESLTANVKIASVCGGFPSSQTFLEVKIAETALAISDGADEIDIVLNLGLFLNNDIKELCEEVDEIKEACHGRKLKVILETGALKTSEKINNASVLALYSGADFLKTSTGKVYPGATLEAAYVMCTAIKNYYKKTGVRKGIKISGGVSTVKDAVNYYTIIKEILGEEWCNQEFFRIGTSRLANTLLEAAQ
ncbi:MAG: deoxyribose-phosphate aldolase [Bacteroidales bacterium]|nr:deoxyribose-phosphate aldolase [Bacteroidales bacterium]